MNTTHLARERRPHAHCQKTQQMKWPPVRRRLCKARAPDRTRQWNLSARTIQPVSQRMEICHRVPAGIAIQSSSGKRSIFSAKSNPSAKPNLIWSLEQESNSHSQSGDTNREQGWLWT